MRSRIRESIRARRVGTHWDLSSPLSRFRRGIPGFERAPQSSELLYPALPPSLRNRKKPRLQGPWKRGWRSVSSSSRKMRCGAAQTAHPDGPLTISRTGSAARACQKCPINCPGTTNSLSALHFRQDNRTFGTDCCAVFDAQRAARPRRRSAISIPSPRSSCPGRTSRPPACRRTRPAAQTVPPPRTGRKGTHQAPPHRPPSPCRESCMARTGRATS